MTFDIVLLALVAAFLGLRLYSVLGKRTGHEQKPITGPQDEAAQSDLPKNLVPRDVAKAIYTAPDNIMPSNVDSIAEEGIRNIMSADRGFNLPQFGEGAKSAYELILTAFWSGDREALAKLCDDNVYADFIAVVDAREKAGQTMENRLVRIESAKIVEAEFDRPMARITVRFDADIAALTKDQDGKIIAGSMTDAIETHDIWTFERDVKNSDRNWTLTATDAA